VDGFGNFVFRVAAKDDVVFSFDGEDRGGANFEMREGRIGTGAFGSIQCAENLRTECGVQEAGEDCVDAATAARIAAKNRAPESR
jgi:hypothetical protein